MAVQQRQMIRTRRSILKLQVCFVASVNDTTRVRPIRCAQRHGKRVLTQVDVLCANFVQDPRTPRTSTAMAPPLLRASR